MKNNEIVHVQGEYINSLACLSQYYDNIESELEILELSLKANLKSMENKDIKFNHGLDSEIHDELQELIYYLQKQLNAVKKKISVFGVYAREIK